MGQSTGRSIRPPAGAAHRLLLRWLRFGLAAAAGLAVVAAPAGAAERGPAPRGFGPVPAEARVIVKFKPGSAALPSAPALMAPHAARMMAARLGLTLVDGPAVGARSQVLRATGLSSEQLAAQLAAQPDVEYASVDARRHASAAVPNDPLFPPNSVQTPAAGQWYLQVPGTTLSLAQVGNDDPLVSAINVQAAWNLSVGSSGVVIADLDTGIRSDHPDFAGKLIYDGGVLQGYDFISDLGRGNNGLGPNPDPTDPGDWITADEANQVGGEFYQCGNQDANGNYIGQNSSWHGTQTAGILAAATNNGVGMASVGHDAMLLPVRVLGKCGGKDSDIIVGMQWAGGIPVPGVPNNPHPAQVLNMSLGGATTCTAAYQDVFAQLAALNVVVVVAAGNVGAAVDSPGNCPGALTVAGVRHTGTKVAYSSLGAEIAISAPAGNCVNTTAGDCIYPILTTSNLGTTTPIPGAAGASYTSSGADSSLGTSFATPLVAGTVALMLSSHPGLTRAQVTSALQSTARTFPTAAATGVAQCVAPTSVAQDECACTTTTCGAGLLDAGQAVAAVATVTASIGVSASSVVVGVPLTLDGSESTPGNAISYAWSIAPGGAAATLAGSASAVATLTPTATGTVTVSLTVTGSAGQSATATRVLNVLSVAPPVVVTSSSGHGGGAMQWGWLLGWLASVIGVWVVTPRRRKRELQQRSAPSPDEAPGD